MKAVFLTLKTDAVVAESYFLREKEIERLAFLHAFPKNCCEVTATLFASSIATKYAESQVFVAKGYSRQNNEWHFWTEIDSVVVDLTAHQFSGYQFPLIHEKPSPLELTFSEVERFQPKNALGRLDFISESLKQIVVLELGQILINEMSLTPQECRCIFS